MGTKTVKIDLSNKLVDEIDSIIEKGHFEDREEFIKYAILKLVEDHD